MSNGPTIIFDKSALQGLNIDEAALFGQFYRAVITPLFFVETLADLEKEVAEGRTPEQVVGGIAAKTGNLTADPSAHHTRLVINNLLGHDTLMDGRPHVVGGRYVTSDGRRGIVFDEAPEADALDRWQKHQFLEVERMMAKQWRESLRRQRLRKMNVKQIFEQIPLPRSLEEVRDYAEAFTQQEGGPAFASALTLLRVPRAYRGPTFLRWLDAGTPPIASFAPYAAYVTAVQLFFQLAVSLDLISGDRPSNAVDIAYLYYLPFCMVFTSSDKLHMKTVPLFLRPDQIFLPGNELKADLRRLDEHFSAQPSEVLERGVMYFEPPFNGDYTTTKLWKHFLPAWRERRGKPGDVTMSVERERELVAEFNRAVEAPEGPPIAVDDADFVAMHHSYPVRMGKWQIVAEDVAQRSWEHERSKRQAKSQDEAVAPKQKK
jgi:hypothetical protein